jgi:non-specific serine/threonine protein kinase
MERERTDELADLVPRDMALAFELLRVVNTAQVRGTQVAIAMVGVNGVRQAS